MYWLSVECKKCSSKLSEAYNINNQDLPEFYCSQCNEWHSLEDTNYTIDFLNE